MLVFVTRRLVSLLLVLVGTTLVLFFVTHVIPADPARAALGDAASTEQIKAYRQALGLDDPLPLQYVRYMQHLLQGDLGISIVTRKQIAQELIGYFPATLELLIPSILLSTVAGIVLGVSSAVARGKWSDHLSRFISLFGLSMPVFWIGLVLQLVFYGNLGWLPAAGRLSISLSPPPTVSGLYVVDSLLAGQWATCLDALKHLILPTIVLSSGAIASTARITRSSMLDVLNADYIRTARGKGLGQRAIIYNHALRNSLIPIVTIIGLRIGQLFGGAVITETIFSWPGVGRYAVNAIGYLDIPVVMGVTLVLVAAYSLVNTIVDMSYFFLDPRTRSVA
jgi:peptide/nickel transport system permease protein